MQRLIPPHWWRQSRHPQTEKVRAPDGQLLGLPCSRNRRGRGIAYAILSKYWKTRAQPGSPLLERTLEDNIVTNKAVLAKLDSIESRLGVVEKTLTDIQ